jgi:hypothetical protein
MPTRKIDDNFAPGFSPCSHPEHDPPSMMVFENGLWEHICPACGHRQVFRVSKPTLATGDVRWVSMDTGAAPRI